MKKRNLFLLSLAVVVAVALGMVDSHRKTKQPVAIVPTPKPLATLLAKATGPAPTAEIPATETPLRIQVAEANGTQIAQPKKNVIQTAPPARVKEPIQDPAARAALNFVGADPEAEAYWLDAINDPNLPANERKDLIEDLNEDGLSDPKHPGPQDLPLIVNRLRLIEQLAPYALDDVNRDAFLEAYKDLNNLLAGNSVP